MLLSFRKSIETVFSLSAHILSTSVFNLAKFDSTTRLDVSISVDFFKSVFVGQLNKSTLTLVSPPKGSYG